MKRDTVEDLLLILVGIAIGVAVAAVPFIATN
jgi:hypothetical protein